VERTRKTSAFWRRRGLHPHLYRDLLVPVEGSGYSEKKQGAADEKGRKMTIRDAAKAGFK